MRKLIDERTHEQILSIMLNNLANTEDKSPNSFNYDILSAAGVIFEEGQRQLIELERKFDVDNLSGDELTKRAEQINGTLRKPATFATGYVQITGVPGTEIPELTAFFAGDRLFYGLSAATIPDEGIVRIEVEADEAGPAGNVLAGQITKIKPRIEGVTEVTNLVPLEGGYDEETDAELLERYYERNLNPPKGGNPAHYKLWATEYPGIWDAKVFREWEGPGFGKVRVVVVSQDRSAVEGRSLEGLRAHILEEAPIRPEKLILESAKEKAIKVGVTIAIKPGADKDSVTAEIRRAIDDYLFQISFRQDFVSLAKIGKAIIDLNRVADYEDLTLDGQQDNVKLAEDEIPTIGDLEVSFT